MLGAGARTLEAHRAEAFAAKYRGLNLTATDEEKAKAAANAAKDRQDVRRAAATRAGRTAVGVQAGI
jgi:hypothetical protein